MQSVNDYKIGELKVLPDNPRIIDTYKYQTLLTSLKEFPDMLRVRPLLIDEDNFILCGNMRYRAAIELGFKTIPARVVNLSEEQKKELVIKDNITYGEWDEEALDKHWDKELYNKWLGYENFDYSSLNYQDLTEAMDTMASGVKKALHIDFGDNFERAKELEKEARGKGLYLGGLFIEICKNAQI